MGLPRPLDRHGPRGHAVGDCVTELAERSVLRGGQEQRRLLLGLQHLVRVDNGLGILLGKPRDLMLLMLLLMLMLLLLLLCLQLCIFVCSYVYNIWRARTSDDKVLSLK